MERLGIVLAPHKREGPTRVLDFLGLRLCNLEGERSISLPEDKREKLSAMIQHYQTTYRPGSRVAPRQLARLLGLLNFAAQVVDGGAVFLDRLYSSFRGVVVDWKGGWVKLGDGRQPMTLTADFFLDLEWWRQNLEARNAVNLLGWDSGAYDCRIAGTDASNWGSGALVWLSGEREEIQHHFTDWERAQPINFRELAGAVRILEEWGPRLAGKRVFIETDNMAAMHCIRKRRARTRTMAEQLRRLYSIAARYDIRITVKHTPGVLLDRPDAISRGHQVAAPRQRFRREVFEPWARSWGFTEGVGGELEHRLERPAGGEQGARRRLWLHPSHGSVAATLQLVGRETERATLAGEDFAGVIVVPAWESAAWRPLLKHCRKVLSLTDGSERMYWKSGGERREGGRECHC
jgi:hypothetical protein